MAFRCATCSDIHEALPHIAFDRPHYAWGVPEAERAARVLLTPDHCVIDGQDFFIRGVLELPLVDAAGSLGYGVWVSQKRENYERYCAEPDSDAIGPFFGWLSSELRGYPASTLNLETMAHFQGPKLRPKIVVRPGDHPLALEQVRGITEARAWEIVHGYWPPQ